MKFLIGSFSVASLFCFYALYPIIHYGKGTSRNIAVELVAEPFVQSPYLVYRWSGDLFRACPTTVRREIIDSQNVVTQLIPRTFSAPPARQFGSLSYELKITVPEQISEGPAVYRAFEISGCNWLERLMPTATPFPEVHFNVDRNNT